MWWAVDQPIPIHPRVDIPSPAQCSLGVCRCSAERGRGAEFGVAEQGTECYQTTYLAHSQADRACSTRYGSHW